jgi:hypothetical protein
VRETVVELHHEVVEEVAGHHHYQPLRLAPRPSSASNRFSQRGPKTRPALRAVGITRRRRRQKR